jgi:anti-sigma regulatory factor (Ser/Thr protein kinase)
MPAGHRALRFPGTLSAFDQAAADLRAALDACGVRGRAHGHAEVVFEEVVTNVMRYGYEDGRPHWIDVSLSCGDAGIVLTFDDDGRPFDPLVRAAPAVPATLDEARIGGLGIVLVRKLSNEVRYERTADARNRLTVTLAAGGEA